MVHTRPDAISVVDPKHSLHDGEAPAPAPGLDRLFSQAQRVTVGGARDSILYAGWSSTGSSLG